MPAKSKAQQKFMGMVYACKKTGNCASKEIEKAAKSISMKDAKDFAKTKRKGLPEKIKESRKRMTFKDFLLESLNYDTNELIDWIINDEGLYHFVRSVVKSAKDSMGNYDEDLIKDEVIPALANIEYLRINWDNVDWDEVARHVED